MRVDKVFIGFALLMLGLALLTIPAGNIGFAGVVLIGPIPIVIGSSPTLAAIGIIIAAAFLLFVYFVTFSFRR